MTDSVAVACLGETMFLVTPVAGESLSTAELAVLSTAGAESNVAINLARLGTPSAWVSRLGSGAIGERVLAAIGERGVDVSAVVIDDTRPTGLLVKNPSPTGSTVTYYRAGSAASGMTRADVDRAIALQPQVLHLSGITAALSASCAEAVEYALTSTVRTSFDVNHRAVLWSDDAAAVELLRLARLADIVFVGLDEAEVLWGTSDAQAVRSLLPEPAVLIVKNSDIDATSFSASATTVVAARVVEVVEPVGAGDAFAAGWLHAHLAGLTERQCLVAGHLNAGAVLRSATDTPDPADPPLTIADIIDASQEGDDVPVS